MSEHTCPTCGADVRIVGNTTLHYEPVRDEQHPVGVAGRVMGEQEPWHDVRLNGMKDLYAALSREARAILGEAYELYEGATVTRDPDAADMAFERLTILREVFTRLGLDVEREDG